MGTKLLIFLAWIFYMATCRSADGVWRFCLIYSCILAICWIFYGMERKDPQNKGRSK